MIKVGRVVDGGDEILGLGGPGHKTTIDVGSGDGRWTYESARKDPATTFIALDPDAESLKEYAFKAARKSARGGVTNAHFVVASVEAPPPEIEGLADEVVVLFPWAALLRGLLRPEPEVLRGLEQIAKEGAALRLVLTYDAGHDHGAGLGEALPGLDEAAIERLRPLYAAAGLAITRVRRLSQAEALAIPSTWGRRLLHGRPREVFEVTMEPSARAAGRV